MLQAVLSQAVLFTSLVPRLPGMRNVHAWRAWYLFSCNYDIFKIGPEFLEQKGNVLRIIQQTLHLMLVPR